METIFVSFLEYSKGMGSISFDEMSGLIDELSSQRKTHFSHEILNFSHNHRYLGYNEEV